MFPLLKQTNKKVMANSNTEGFSAGENQNPLKEICSGKSWGLTSDIREQGPLIQLPWPERGVVIMRWGTHTSLVGKEQNLGLPQGLGKCCVIFSR